MKKLITIPIELFKSSKVFPSHASVESTQFGLPLNTILEGLVELYDFKVRTCSNIYGKVVVTLSYLFQSVGR